MIPLCFVYFNKNKLYIIHNMVNLIKNKFIGLVMISKNYNVWILSFLFAFTFVFIISWIDIKGHDFEDIVQYIRRMVYLHAGGKEEEYTGILWITSEPLWKFIIMQLANVCDDYRWAMYLVSFISIGLHATFLFRRIPVIVAVVFLINPMTVDLMMAQVRIALAFGLVLVAYDLKSKKLAILLMFSALLIHASMPIFIGMYYILFELNKRIEAKKLYLTALAMGILMAVFMKYGVNSILSAIGDRHADYANDSVVSTVSYSIIWILISGLIATFSSFENEEDRLLATYVIVFMSFFFFASTMGVFGKRYVSVSMVIIVASLSTLPKHIKEGTYVLLFMYNIYLFKFWLVK